MVVRRSVAGVIDGNLLKIGSFPAALPLNRKAFCQWFTLMDIHCD